MLEPRSSGYVQPDTTASLVMVLFAFACLSVMAAAIVLEMTSEEGVLTVSPKVWYAVLAVMGIWLLVLAAAG